MRVAWSVPAPAAYCETVWFLDERRGTATLAAMRIVRLGTRALLSLCASLCAGVSGVPPVGAQGVAHTAVSSARVVEYRFVDPVGDVARHAADLVAVSVRVEDRRMVVTADVLGAGPADEFTFALDDANGGYAYGNIDHTGGPSAAFPGCATSHLRRDRAGGVRLRISTGLRCVRGVDLGAVRITIRLLRAPVYPEPAYTPMDEFVSPWIRLT